MARSKIFVNEGDDGDSAADPQVLHVFDFSLGLLECCWSTIAVQKLVEFKRFVKGAALVYKTEGRILFIGGNLGPEKSYVTLYTYNLSAEKVESIVECKDENIKSTINTPIARRNFCFAHLPHRIWILGGDDIPAKTIYKLDI